MPQSRADDECPIARREILRYTKENRGTVCREIRVSLTWLQQLLSTEDCASSACEKLLFSSCATPFFLRLDRVGDVDPRIIPAYPFWFEYGFQSSKTLGLVLCCLFTPFGRENRPLCSCSCLIVSSIVLLQDYATL